MKGRCVRDCGFLAISQGCWLLGGGWARRVPEDAHEAGKCPPSFELVFSQVLSASFDRGQISARGLKVYKESLL